MKKKPCEECGTEFDPERSTARFCKPECRVKWNRKQEAQGDAGAEKIPEKKFGGGGEEKRADVAMAAVQDVVSKVPVGKKIRVRIWPAGMKREEVEERLHRMRDYNASMRKQGTPQYCSDEGYVMARLAEALADVKLARMVLGKETAA